MQAYEAPFHFAQIDVPLLKFSIWPSLMGTEYFGLLKCRAGIILSVQPKLAVKTIIVVTRDGDNGLDNKQVKVIIKKKKKTTLPSCSRRGLSLHVVCQKEHPAPEEPRNLVIALWKGDPPSTLSYQA